MKIFTKSPLQNVLRIMVLLWLAYVAIGILQFLYQNIPLVPTNSLFGFHAEEPSLMIAIMTLVITTFATVLITAFPALFFWAWLEDKFWPQTGTLINFKEDSINHQIKAR